MRIWLSVLALALALSPVLGCRTSRPAAPASSKTPSDGETRKAHDNEVVLPTTVLNGKVARVNQNGRFVVVVFPVGQLPRMEQRLGVYREGLKVGEIKFTGPQLDDTVVADIAAGEVREGDVVRE